MPIACDPKQTIWFSLDIDSDKPDKLRPEFQCRFLTTAEVRRVGSAINEALKLDDDQAGDILDDAICIGVTGWRNMRNPAGKTIKFSRDALSDVLTPLEKYELAGKCVRKTSADEVDRKKSAWQSQSSAAASASDATAPQESA